MGEINDAAIMMAKFVREKDPDEWWIFAMKQQINKVMRKYQRLKRALREAPDSSDLMKLQKDIIHEIKKLDYSIGKSHYIDAQVDQTAEILSDLINRRLLEIRDSEYRDLEDDDYDSDDIQRFI